MKYSIVKNPKRNTVTLVLSPVVFNYTHYLFEKYKDEKFFASGIIDTQDYAGEVQPFIKELVEALNEVAKEKLPSGENFVATDIMSLNDDEYRFITKNIDNRDGSWDKRFKVNLSSKSKSPSKKFLFKKLGDDSSLTEEESKDYKYGVEVEIGVGYNEDNLEKYIYTVFHRAIAVEKRASSTGSYQANDSAWSGFDFNTKGEDLPF